MSFQATFSWTTDILGFYSQQSLFAMPATETHVQVGKHLGGWGGGGVAAYHFLTPSSIPLLESFSPVELPLYALTVWAATRIGSHLPDLIEPAEDPGHRGPFHSVTAYLLTLGKVLWLWVGFAAPSAELLWTYGRVFLVFLGISYMAHLHLDAHTPDSIPWFSR